MWTWSRRAAAEIEPLRDGYTMNVVSEALLLEFREAGRLQAGFDGRCGTIQQEAYQD
jgi:hypothetical protein